MSHDHRLVPLLVVRSAAEAIDFYVRALGATVTVRYDNKVTSTVSHADLAVADALFAVTEEARAWGSDAPPSLGGSPVVLQLLVADAAAALDRACTAGASVLFPLQEFCGEYMARVRDPYGHLWILRQRVEFLTPEENQRRRDILFASFATASTQRTEQESRRPTASSSPPCAAPSSASAPLALQSAVELARKIRRKELSSFELTKMYIDRIERLDGRLGAVPVRDFERALDAARTADAAQARGEVLGPLHGLAVTVKESFDVAGLPSTWGARPYAGNVASQDAAVVARLRAAGANLLGKSNVPFMLGDFQSHNELYGTTKNPWDEARGPGGSSGGAAAALAAGLTALECGSDLGGSVRNPAHYCGVYAHKPTGSIVSMRGHALPSVSPPIDMAVAGPLARSADDLLLALDVLAGPDRRAAAAWRLELPQPRRATLRGLRVAVWPTDAIARVDHAIAERVQRVAEVVATRGGIVSDRTRPAFEASAYRRVYAALVCSAQGAASSESEYEAHRRRATALDPAETSRMAAVTRSLVLDHRAWVHLDVERRRLQDVWSTFFDEWDLLVCPIMATTALPHDRRPVIERTITVNGDEQPYFEQVFWACLASLANLPATVFPVGLSAEGLPIGLQAIGAAHADRTTIAFAKWMADEMGGFSPPPAFA